MVIWSFLLLVQLALVTCLIRPRTISSLLTTKSVYVLQMAFDKRDANNGNMRGNRLKEQAEKIRQELAALQASVNETSAIQSSVNQFATDKPPSIIPVRGTYNASSAIGSNLTASSESVLEVDPITINRRELIVKAEDIAANNDRIGQIFGSAKGGIIEQVQEKQQPDREADDDDDDDDEEEEYWVYSEPSAYLMVDKLDIKPLVTDINQEIERQYPGVLNWTARTNVAWCLESFLSDAKEDRYPTLALQSLYRQAAVEVMFTLPSMTAAMNLMEMFPKFNSGEIDITALIEERMEEILDEKFKAAGLQSPHAIQVMKVRANKAKQQQQQQQQQHEEEVQKVKKQLQKQKQPKGLLSSSAAATSSLPSSATVTVDRKKLSDLSAQLDAQIAALPQFSKLSILSFVTAYQDPDLLAMLDIPPEDLKDKELIKAALKTAFVYMFLEEEKKQGWFKNPLAVVGSLRKLVNEEEVAGRVKTAIEGIKEVLPVVTMTDSAADSKDMEEDENDDLFKSLIVSPSSSSSSSTAATAKKEKLVETVSLDSLLDELPSLAKDLQSALNKDDKAELQRLLRRLSHTALIIDALRRGQQKQGSSSNSNSGSNSGSSSNKEPLFSEGMLRDLQAPEKKLFNQLDTLLSSALDDLLAADNKDQSKGKNSGLLDKLQNLRSNNTNTNNEKRKEKSKLFDRMEQISASVSYRSAAEKFIVTYFDSTSREEVGEISRKGASALQSLLLTDIFRVTRVKFFSGAVIFGGQLILRNREQFVENIQQRLKETKLDNDFGLIVLDDRLEVEADVSIAELSTDEPFPTVIVFPKAWRSRVEVNLEATQKKLLTGKKFISFFYTAIITSFCAMSAGVLDITQNSDDPNAILASLPSTEQLQTMTWMIIATLGIQGVSNLVESIMAQQRGVKLTHTSIPGWNFLTFGAKSTYLSLVRSWRDVFDLSAAHVGTAMTLSLTAMSLGLKIMASEQSKEVIAAYPTLAVGFLQINAFVKALVTSQFPDIFFGMEPQSLVHLHWLVIVGAMSFIGQVTQLLPGDNTAGDKMLFAISKDDGISALGVRLSLGVVKSFLLITSVFNLFNINEGITRAKLLIGYTIMGGVGRDDSEVGPPVINRYSDLNEARKILYFLFTFIAIASFLPTDINWQAVLESVASSTPQLDALFRPTG